MPKHVNLLSATRVRQEKQHGRHHDGNGLYLEIDDHGKRWALRLTINGRRTWVGLGSVDLKSLAEAREDALERRKAAMNGDTARTHTRPARAVEKATSNGLTFKQAFDRHFNEHIRSTLDQDYAVSYAAAVEALLMPTIGHMDVAEIQPKHIIEAIKTPWSKTPARARKVLQRATRVFQWAIAQQLRREAEPCKAAREVLGKTQRRTEHRAYIPWQEAPDFLAWLRTRDGAHPSTTLCLEMIMATGLRSWEARAAKWGEFDLTAREWRVPGHDSVVSSQRGFQKKRMKRGVDHLVPLSSLALSILQRAHKLRQSDKPEALVFPSARSLIISDNTLSKLLRDAGIEGTPHGLRATLRTWCQDIGVNEEVGEAILAHKEPDLTKAAYKRATYFEARTAVLQNWADFLETKRPEK